MKRKMKKITTWIMTKTLPGIIICKTFHKNHHNQNAIIWQDGTTTDRCEYCKREWKGKKLNPLAYWARKIGTTQLTTIVE